MNDIEQIQDTFIDYVLNPLAELKDTATDEEKARINEAIDDMIRELRDLKKQ